ncbi:hypothetical protein SUDANB145_06228 [Streptomyces sp. enrichment culture]
MLPPLFGQYSGAVGGHPVADVSPCRAGFGAQPARTSGIMEFSALRALGPAVPPTHRRPSRTARHDRRPVRPETSRPADSTIRRLLAETDADALAALDGRHRACEPFGRHHRRTARLRAEQASGPCPPRNPSLTGSRARSHRGPATAGQAPVVQRRAGQSLPGRARGPRGPRSRDGLARGGALPRSHADRPAMRCGASPARPRGRRAESHHESCGVPSAGLLPVDLGSRLPAAHGEPGACDRIHHFTSRYVPEAATTGDRGNVSPAVRAR